MTNARLLVVDDQEIILDTLQELLGESGYQVDAASSGPEALRLIEDKSYDLVLSDIKMPEMTGLELLERIKQHDPHVPVIMITGFPSISIATEAMKKGASDFITKPFDVELVQHMIRRTLRERQLFLQNQNMLAEINQKAVIEKLNRDLNQKIEELTKLLIINERLSPLSENEQIFAEAVRLAAEITNAEKVSLMIYDRSMDCLVVRAACGLESDVIRRTRVPLGEGIVGKVAQNRRPMFHRKFEEDETGLVGLRDKYFTSSFISVPLTIDKELIGVLNVTDKSDHSDFTETDWMLIEQLGEKLSTRIENNVLYEGIYSNLIDTLESLVFTIEARDSYTRQHSARVTSYSVEIARRLGFSEDDLEMLKFSGILHDIGKIGVSDRILLKPGSLTTAEYNQIKQHPVIGDQIVEPLGLSPIERHIIRHHHERLDGKGYPDGLRGDRIPMLVRVVSVADCFDAMTTNRPYRGSMTLEMAFEEMHRCSGTQLDRVAVDAFIECVEKKIIFPPDPNDPTQPKFVEYHSLRKTG